MRLKRLRYTLALLTVAALLAQQQPPTILRSTTRLVQISVIAQDSKGQPIADLRKEDFQIKVNGHPQSIAVFSVDSTGALPMAPQQLPPNIYTNRLQQRAGTPSSVTIILLDTLNTKITDQAYARDQVVKYLQTIQPGEHIGIYALGSSLRVLHDYTTDSTELLRRLAAYKGGALPNLAESGSSGALDRDALLLDSWLRGNGASGPERDFYTVDRVNGTLKAIEFIANHLERLPGRKNLIWVSGGFPMQIGFDSLSALRDPTRDQRTFSPEITHAVKAVNDANMAIYPVDARGLMADPKFDASRPSSAVRSSARPTLRPPVGVKNQDSMIELASRTGGRAYYNTNDLKDAIRDAVNDSRVTYTLGFYPSEEKFDGKFHEIKVQTVERSGVKLRYRKGYFDLPEQQQDDQTRKAELRDAVWSPIDASGLGLIAQVKLIPSNSGALDAVIKIDHTAISLQQDAEHWVGRLDILFVQKDDRGRQFNGTDDTVNLNLVQATYDKLMKDDLLFHKVINRASQAQELRIVVRDAASGAIGSITIPLNHIT